jgi:hypothetical protein
MLYSLLDDFVLASIVKLMLNLSGRWLYLFLLSVDRVNPPAFEAGRFNRTVNIV